MDKLLQQVLETKPPIPVKPIPFTNNTNLVESAHIEDNKTNHRDKEQLSSCSSVQSNSPKENVNMSQSCSSSSSSSSSTSSSSSLTYAKTQNENCFEPTKPDRIFCNGKITILNRNAELSNQNEPKSPTSTQPSANKLPVKQRLTFPEKTNSNEAHNQIDTCCLFCQKEESGLIGCGNRTCKGAFCDNCLLKFLSRQKSHKCPSCSLDIDKNVIACLRDDRSSSSSSSSPTRTHHYNSSQHYHNGNSNNLNSRLQFNSQPRQMKPLANNTNSYNNNNNNSVASTSGFGNKFAILDGRLYLRKIDEPCDGYENFKSILVTFEIEDGVQNVSLTQFEI